MAKEPEKETEEAPKSKKKLIIMIVAALLVLGGGGGAAWYFMQPAPDAEQQAGEEAAEEEAYEESAEPVFVPLDTFTVNLQPDPEERFLQVDITLQTSSQDVADILSAQMPAVRNRVLLLLTSKQSIEISDAEGKALLSDEILEALQQPYSKKGKELPLDSVLFTSFVIQ